MPLDLSAIGFQARDVWLNRLPSSVKLDLPSRRANLGLPAKIRGAPFFYLGSSPRLGPQTPWVGLHSGRCSRTSTTPLHAGQMNCTPAGNDQGGDGTAFLPATATRVSIPIVLFA